jgi:hypothetical protein
MAYGYGLADISTINSEGLVGGGSIIRMFDVAMVNTSAVVSIISLYNGTSTADIPLVRLFQSAVDSTTVFNSNAGVRFNKGCFVVATGCTATVNFIKEL